MDGSTYRAISEAALDLIDYCSFATELRKIARFVAEPSHKKQLERIARRLEREIPQSCFNAAKLTAYEIVILLQSDKYLSDEEISAKIGKAPSTVKQAIGALRAGGIEFEESVAKGFRIQGKKGYGKRRSISGK
jgi:biotin operon repressor